MLAAAPFVSIVFGVAAVTVRRHIVELPFDVATDARVFPVFADEREVRNVVIELHLCPTDRGVASGALGAERLIMRVCVLVTVETLRWRFSMFGTGFMAGIALGFLVLAGKPEISKIVVEGTLIELHDVGVAPFVIGVAFRAVQVLCLQIPTVVSTPRFHVRRDVFMAVQAKGALVGALERQVTIAAFGLVLRVSFDDIARHHQCLDLGACILCRKTHRHQRKSD